VLNPGILDSDKGLLASPNIIFYIYQSNVEINRIYFKTHYDVALSNNLLILPISLYERRLALYNWDFLHEGGLLFTFHYLNLDIENSTFDMYKSQGGVALNYTCPYPFLNPKTYVRLETVKFYFSQGKRVLIYWIDRISGLNPVFPPFAIFEAQTVTLNNVEFNMYGGADHSALSFGVWTEDNWDPNDMEFRYFNFTNISITLWKSDALPPTQQHTGVYFR